MTEKKNNETAGDEPIMGYAHNARPADTEGGVVRVKTRTGEMVEVPKGTRSLSDVVASGGQTATPGPEDAPAAARARAPQRMIRTDAGGGGGEPTQS